MAHELRALVDRDGARTLHALVPSVPYASNDDLPPAVQVLPEHGQDIFRAAFNGAYDRNHDEAMAFRMAWSAVNRVYEKIGGEWTLR